MVFVNALEDPGNFFFCDVEVHFVHPLLELFFIYVLVVVGIT